MIPKKIHYCWFGGNPKPELALKCMESWQKFCPDYELVEWNETNFDVSCNVYANSAYAMKKYAFVSDFVRLYALYHQGGIYMDTDVMLLKKLDDYLKHQAFSGFEDKSKISTGIMGAEKGNELMGRLLDYYDTAQFFKSDGRPDLTTNVETITSMLLPLGLVPNGEFQIVSGMALYPQNIFCPDHKRLQDSRYMADAVTIHYFAGSWKSEKTRKRENSFVWRVLAKPATWSSRVLRFFFGNRWIAVKDKILERIKRGE